MAVEQIKEEAKKRFDQDLTDEQAEAILKSDGAEELSGQALEEVTGGTNNVKITYLNHNLNHNPPDDSEMPPIFAFLNQLNEEATKLLGQGLPSELTGAILKGYGSGELSAQELEEVRGGSDLKLRIPFPKDLLAKLEPYVPDGPLKEWMTAHGSEELSDLDLDGVAGGGCGSDDPATRDPEDDTPQNQQ